MTWWWVVPTGFWLVGMMVMASGSYVGHKLSEKKEQLQEKAQAKQFQDQDASIYYGIKQEMLNMMPWVSVRLFCVLIGMVIFTFGFVALSFVI